MLDKKYKEYLLEVQNYYGLEETEVKGLFLSSIAKAYDAIGSAYIWEDGTVSVSKIDKRKRSKISLVDYNISSVMYQRIVDIFIEKVREYSFKRDEVLFLKKIQGKVFRVSVKNSMVLVSPLLELGGFSKYNFVLKRSEMFWDEKVAKGDELKVVLKSIGENIVYVSRLHLDVCKGIFEEKFRYLSETLKEVYEYKSLDIFVDKKRKKVLFFVEWKVMPNSYFKSLLQKELQKVIKSSEILLKVKGNK